MLILNLQRKTLITLDIFYYLPDYTSIIQEFLWQTEDTAPDYSKMHRFLRFWKDNIDAVISEVLFRESSYPEWKKVDSIL